MFISSPQIWLVSFCIRGEASKMKRKQGKVTNSSKSPHLVLTIIKQSHKTWEQFEYGQLFLPSTTAFAEPPKKEEAEMIQFEKMPNSSSFKIVRTSSKSEASHSSSSPKSAVERSGWIEAEECFRDLVTSESISGEFFHTSESLTRLQDLRLESKNKCKETSKDKSILKKEKHKRQELLARASHCLDGLHPSLTSANTYNCSYRMTCSPSTRNGLMFYLLCLKDLLTTFWRVCTGCSLKNQVRWSTWCKSAIR